MRKYIVYFVFLFVGIIIGGVIMGYLSIRASHIYLETFRIKYEYEQELLAAHKRNDGALYWELAHRKNVVDMSPPVELKSFTDMKKLWGYEFPFASLILERISNIPNSDQVYKVHKGQKIARLADNLERLGMKKEAEEKWKEAARLLGHNDIKKAKEMITMWYEIEDKWIETEGTPTHEREQMLSPDKTIERDVH